MTSVTGAEKDLLDLALGKGTCAYSQLTPEGLVYALRTLVADFATPKLVAYKHLWEIAEERPENTNGGARAYGERVLGEEVVMRKSQFVSLDRKTDFYLLHTRQVFPAPFPAAQNFYGDAPMAGATRCSEVYVVCMHSGKGRILRWDVEWQCYFEAPHFSEGVQLPQRAISWKGTRSTLYSCSDWDLIEKLSLGNGGGGHFLGIMHVLVGAMTQAGSRLEKRLENHRRRSASLSRALTALGM